MQTSSDPVGTLAGDQLLAVNQLPDPPTQLFVLASVPSAVRVPRLPAEAGCATA